MALFKFSSETKHINSDWIKYVCLYRRQRPNHPQKHGMWMEFKRLECMDGWLNGWRQCWHVERLGQKTQPSIESIKVIVSTHITYDFHSLYCFYVNIRLINARKMLGKYLYSLIYHQNVNPNEKKHTNTPNDSPKIVILTCWAFVRVYFLS